MLIVQEKSVIMQLKLGRREKGGVSKLKSKIFKFVKKPKESVEPQPKIEN